ncbi:MAG: TIGR03960 family B12-binding radical SAM protein [Pirellulales bacterium]
MLNQRLKDHVVSHILPRVQTPGQYIGGELNMVRKDRREGRGRLCLAFPDTYAIGMSHNGLQVLYAVMNARDDWACERSFSPWPDMEKELRAAGLPLFSLETFTPLAEFDVLGFTLQFDACASNVLTMLDLGGLPLHATERTMEHPLVIAGGPCAFNPEPLSPFIDLFVIGDGETTLPAVCDEWLKAKGELGLVRPVSGRSSVSDREEALARLAARLPFVYVPRFYRAEYGADGRLAAFEPTRPGVPERIEPAVLDDLDAFPLPVRPVVPNVECVHDRIAIEIMRGCPWHCRFCQSTCIKRPVRFRRVETIVEAALETYRHTGYNEISLLSLSTGDYPHIEELIRRLHETFRPLDVSVSVPSLRVNESLRSVAAMLTTARHSALTLAPEVARDAMREKIGKRINNEDLYEGCRPAFAVGFQQVKLYFMCGLPGETDDDLEGIVEMSERISRLGKEVSGRAAKVTASVSNFVPKPHTPFQWSGMQTREYFEHAHHYLRRRRLPWSVAIKCHAIESSLLEGVLSRGDRRLGEAIELAWRRGARFDGWTEHAQPGLWWQALADCGIDIQSLVHLPYPVEARLPWDHLGIRQGREYLEKEWRKSEE